MRPALLLAVLLVAAPAACALLGSCGSAERAAEAGARQRAPAASPSPCAAPRTAAPVATPSAPAFTPPGDARVAETAGGRFRVAWRVDAPPEQGKPFALEAWVVDARSGALASEVELSADAAMPEHEHGMVRVPRVARLEPGHWRVEGLYLHMLGRWELYLDVTRGARTERASWELWLD